MDLNAKIDLGYGGALIDAQIARDASSTRVRATARAHRTALESLMPAALIGKLAGINAGVLNWNMSADVALAKTAGVTAIEKLDVQGILEVANASLQLPGSERSYRDVSFKVRAEKAGIRLERLSARESDSTNSGRRFDASGFVAIKNLKPESATLSIAAKDWLLFGPPKLGAANAPRAELDADIGIEAKLTRAIPEIKATVRALELRAPERYERGHQPLAISPGGDVIFIEEGARAGLLPVTSATVAAPQAAKPMPTLDIVVDIPRPIRLNSAPLDVYASGSIKVEMRPSGKRTRGVITMNKGTIGVFGHKHALRSGSFEFSDKHPEGHMALSFSRKLPPATARQLSAEAAADGLVFSLAGDAAKPELSFSGAANSLLDFMAVHNAGRATYQTQLGLPASQTVQVPRGDQPMVLTFISDNLPHLLFLDRVSAWADPYAGKRSYGRVENFEGETYSTNQKSRVRVVTRAPTQGRSQAEVHVDRMLINDDRKAVGVGVRAGSRLGGGVGLFFEWTSDD